MFTYFIKNWLNNDGYFFHILNSRNNGVLKVFLERIEKFKTFYHTKFIFIYKNIILVVKILQKYLENLSEIVA